MPGFDVKVDDNLTSTNWRLWMNGPSPAPAPVLVWREQAMAVAKKTAQTLAPVNNPLNAKHRGGTVGTYLASIYVERTGNQYGRGFRLGARAPHAAIVENGRSASTKDQYFSWSAAGGVARWYEKTSGRDGDHVIERAAESAVAITTALN